MRKRKEKVEEDILDETGPDKELNERVFNYKVATEKVREIEIKGISFIAKFYKTTAQTEGIRVPLQNNSVLFDKFFEYSKELKDKRKEIEEKSNLIAFSTFGREDKGLEFFGNIGFYVFPLESKKEEPHLVFNEEKNSPSPIEKLEEFVDYYRKKFGIKVRPKKSTFEHLKALDLTEI